MKRTALFCGMCDEFVASANHDLEHFDTIGFSTIPRGNKHHVVDSILGEAHLARLGDFRSHDAYSLFLRAKLFSLSYFPYIINFVKVFVNADFLITGCALPCTDERAGG